jgi:hypothetical protein
LKDREHSAECILKLNWANIAFCEAGSRGKTYKKVGFEEDRHEEEEERGKDKLTE